jgi:hypothetical protein
MLHWFKKVLLGDPKDIPLESAQNCLFLGEYSLVAASGTVITLIAPGRPDLKPYLLHASTPEAAQHWGEALTLAGRLARARSQAVAPEVPIFTAPLPGSSDMDVDLPEESSSDAVRFKAGWLEKKGHRRWFLLDFSRGVLRWFRDEPKYEGSLRNIDPTLAANSLSFALYTEVTYSNADPSVVTLEAPSLSHLSEAMANAVEAEIASERAIVNNSQTVSLRRSPLRSSTEDLSGSPSKSSTQLAEPYVLSTPDGTTASDWAEAFLVAIHVTRQRLLSGQNQFDSKSMYASISELQALMEDKMSEYEHAVVVEDVENDEPSDDGTWSASTVRKVSSDSPAINATSLAARMKQFDLVDESASPDDPEANRLRVLFAQSMIVPHRRTVFKRYLVRTMHLPNLLAFVDAVDAFIRMEAVYLTEIRDAAFALVGKWIAAPDDPDSSALANIPITSGSRLARKDATPKSTPRDERSGSDLGGDSGDEEEGSGALSASEGSASRSQSGHLALPTPRSTRPVPDAPVTGRITVLPAQLVTQMRACFTPSSAHQASSDDLLDTSLAVQHHLEKARSFVIRHMRFDIFPAFAQHPVATSDEFVQPWLCAVCNDRPVQARVTGDVSMLAGASANMAGARVKAKLEAIAARNALEKLLDGGHGGDGEASDGASDSTSRRTEGDEDSDDDEEAVAAAAAADTPESMDEPAIPTVQELYLCQTCISTHLQDRQEDGGAGAFAGGNKSLGVVGASRRMVDDKHINMRTLKRAARKSLAVKSAMSTPHLRMAGIHQAKEKQESSAAPREYMMSPRRRLTQSDMQAPTPARDRLGSSAGPQSSLSSTTPRGDEANRRTRKNSLASTIAAALTPRRARRNSSSDGSATLAVVDPDGGASAGGALVQSKSGRDIRRRFSSSGSAAKYAQAGDEAVMALRIAALQQAIAATEGELPPVADVDVDTTPRSPSRPEVIRTRARKLSDAERAEIPAMCETCGIEPPRARVERAGVSYWLCRPCVLDTETHFKKAGTLRGSLITSGSSRRVMSPRVNVDAPIQEDE